MILEGLAGDREARRRRSRSDEQDRDLVGRFQGPRLAQLEDDWSVAWQRAAAARSRPPASASSATLEVPGLDLEPKITMCLEGLVIELLHQPATMDDPDPRRQPIDLAEDVAGHEDRDALVGRESCGAARGSR